MVYGSSVAARLQLCLDKFRMFAPLCLGFADCFFFIFQKDLIKSKMSLLEHYPSRAFYARVKKW